MHLIIGVAAGVLLILLVRYLSRVLLPFFVACFIAYLLQPVVEFNRRVTHLKGRTLPSVLTLLEIVVAIGLVVYLFLPSVVSELNELGKILHDVSSGKTQMPPLYRWVVDFINKYFNPDALHSYLSGDRLMAIIDDSSL